MSQLEEELSREARAFWAAVDNEIANRAKSEGRLRNDTEHYNASDRDSARSKEVVTEDHRDRQDGPGGN